MRSILLENPPLFRTVLEDGFIINWILKSLEFTAEGNLRYFLLFSKDDLPPDMDKFMVNNVLIRFGSREKGKEKHFTVKRPIEVDLSCCNEIVEFQWTMHQYYDSEAIEG